MASSRGQTKGIIDGFEDDFKEIVQDFSSRFQDMEFSNFLEYWSNNFLDCIFANRFDPRELLEAISVLNQLLTDIITDSSPDDKRKVLALYLLLCIYVKQPERLRRKIRLTCRDAILIQNISHPDVGFVWRKLKDLQAIDFVEERLVYGPSMLTARGEGGNQNLKSDESKESILFLESKIEPALSQMDSICEFYEQIATDLRLDCSFRNHLEEAKTLVKDFKQSVYDDIN